MGIFDKQNKKAFKPAKRVSKKTAEVDQRASFATKDTSAMSYLQFRSYVNALLVSQDKKKLTQQTLSRAWQKERDRREIQAGKKRRSGELRVLAKDRKSEAREAQQKRRAAAAGVRSARRKGPKLPASRLPKVPKINKSNAY